MGIQRSAKPCSFAIIVPLERYFLVGTTTDWQPSQMLWSPQHHCFRSQVQIGLDGWESFQILVDGDFTRCIHPDMEDAGAKTSSWEICGPDDDGHDRNWTIGMDSVNGAHYDVRLFLWEDGSI